jgi:hypothetical protein
MDMAIIPNAEAEHEKPTKTPTTFFVTWYDDMNPN